MLARVGLAARAPRHAGLAQRLGRGYRVVIKLTFYLEAGALEHYSMRFAAAREEGTSPNGRRERERDRERSGRGVKPLESKEARNCARLSLPVEPWTSPPSIPLVPLALTFDNDSLSGSLSLSLSLSLYLSLRAL